jgi:hypothetical protein
LGRLCLGSHEDGGDVSGIFKPPQRSQGIAAVHIGHHHVEEREVGMKVSSGCEGGGA